MDTNSAPPKTSRLPNRSARRRDTPMPRIMQTMPQALNRLNADVAGSFGQANPDRPMPLSAALTAAMKRLNPELSRKPARAVSLM
ncbi:hypothetical protein D3C73_1258960 [compost metagenome]